MDFNMVPVVQSCWYFCWPVYFNMDNPQANSSPARHNQYGKGGARPEGSGL